MTFTQPSATRRALMNLAEAAVEQACLGLWAQVVLQAKADLEQEPLGSLLYSQAESFFVGSGEWAESRAIVGDCLDIPAANLCACGKEWIAARRAREGLPAEPLPAPPSSPATQPTVPVRLPLLVALPGPTLSELRNRWAKNRRTANPFDPFRAKRAV